MKKDVIEFDKSDYIEKKNQTLFLINCTVKISELNEDSESPYANNLKTILKFKSQSLEDFLPILRSNAILMLYNCIESTVINIIKNIYFNINSENITYIDLNKSFQSLWRDYQFKENMSQPFSGKKAAAIMIKNIICKKVISFDGNYAHLAGNADFGTISQILEKHCIKLKNGQTTEDVKVTLNNIKTQRNRLAHGNVSFREVGKDFSNKDIVKISKQVFKFLEKIIKLEESFVAKKYYLKNGVN